MTIPKEELYREYAHLSGLVEILSKEKKYEQARNTIMDSMQILKAFIGPEYELTEKDEKFIDGETEKLPRQYNAIAQAVFQIEIKSNLKNIDLAKKSREYALGIEDFELVEIYDRILKKAKELQISLCKAIENPLGFPVPDVRFEERDGVLYLK